MRQSLTVDLERHEVQTMRRGERVPLTLTNNEVIMLGFARGAFRASPNGHEPPAEAAPPWKAAKHQGRHFPPDVKQAAIDRLVKAGGNGLLVDKIAQDLDLAPHTIHAWIRKTRVKGKPLQLWRTCPICKDGKKYPFGLPWGRHRAHHAKGGGKEATV